MALIDEAYRVKFFYRQGTNEAMMIANWQLLTFTPGATETLLARAFFHDFEVNTVKPVRHSTSSCYRVEVQETFGGLDFGVVDGDIPGALGTDPAPSFNAIAIRQNVGTHLVRPGQKRIPFIAEGIMNGNTPALSIGQEAALELGFGEIIEITYTDELLNDWVFTLRPLVVGTTLNPETNEYFLDPAKQVPVTSAEVTRITSQNSRKS